MKYSALLGSYALCQAKYIEPVKTNEGTPLAPKKGEQGYKSTHVNMVSKEHFDGIYDTSAVAITDKSKIEAIAKQYPDKTKFDDELVEFAEKHQGRQFTPC